MQLYLVRHTRPAVPSGICYGQSDVELAHASFAEESRQIIDKLSEIAPDYIISSPLRRCYQLAERLVCASAIEYTTDPRLMELNFGQWEMQTWNRIARSELDQWGAHYVDQGPPDGESFMQLAQRVNSAIDEYQHCYPDKGILLITHAGVIRAILSTALAINLRDSFRLQIDYGSLTKINYTAPHPTIGYINR